VWEKGVKNIWVQGLERNYIMAFVIITLLVSLGGCHSNKRFEFIGVLIPITDSMEMYLREVGIDGTNWIGSSGGLLGTR
jgi:hypothetical protein